MQLKVLCSQKFLCNIAPMMRGNSEGCKAYYLREFRAINA